MPSRIVPAERALQPDFFALLELPRRPLLETEEVQAAFVRLGGEAHPDRAGGNGDAFATLHSARQTLLDPALRIRHLLRLEENTLPASGAVPEPIAPYFLSIGKLLHDVDGFLAKRSATTSALARALLAPEEIALQDRCMAALTDLAEVAELVELDGASSLVALDTRWQRDKIAAAPALATYASTFTFLQRWSNQIRERLNRLAFDDPRN